MVRDATKWSFFRARRRVLVFAALICAGGLAAAACGDGPSGSTAAASGSGASSSSVRSASCAAVAGTHHARVVVEPSAGKVVTRCVGFSGKNLPALTLLAKSHIEVSTQSFSFGVAICQLDDVPAHFSQCLPSGAPYWALFVSKNGHTWTSPSVGVSDVTVPPGGSLGFRYDPPTGTPAPPPRPTPAT